jgi:hypothetical protein
MFSKRTPVLIHLNDDFSEDINFKKNDVNFSIRIKETIENDNDTEKYVWFIHVFLPKRNKWKLCAYGRKTFNLINDCQNDALNFLQSLKYDYYKFVKDL